MTTDQSLSQPGFVRDMTERYFSRTVSQFILHGAVRDLVPLREGAATNYVPLEEYLEKVLFAQRGSVIF
jgi:hypothetical protein